MGRTTGRRRRGRSANIEGGLGRDRGGRRCACRRLDIDGTAPVRRAGSVDRRDPDLTIECARSRVDSGLSRTVVPCRRHRRGHPSTAARPARGASARCRDRSAGNLGSGARRVCPSCAANAVAATTETNAVTTGVAAGTCGAVARCRNTAAATCGTSPNRGAVGGETSGSGPVHGADVAPRCRPVSASDRQFLAFAPGRLRRSRSRIARRAPRVHRHARVRDLRFL